MDVRERIGDPVETFRICFEGLQSGIWTAIPCLVVSYDPATGTIQAQATIQSINTSSTGEVTFENRSLLVKVPVMYQRGGNATMTFPIGQGDECLVVFSSRAIDNWWQSGGVQPPFDPRMHNPSDGFAFVGPFSKPQMLENVSASTVQIRSNDSKVLIELDPAGDIVNIVAPGGINIKGPVAITGPVTVTQTIAAMGMISSQVDVISGTVSGKSHLHGGVQPGGSDTTPPIP